MYAGEVEDTRVEVMVVDLVVEVEAEEDVVEGSMVTTHTNFQHVWKICGR